MDQQSGIDPEPCKWTLADLTCRLRQRLLEAPSGVAKPVLHR
jgi:hypothetical protein